MDIYEALEIAEALEEKLDDSYDVEIADMVDELLCGTE